MIICTHNGNFHADELFAISLILKVVGPCEIIRSRDPKDWARADFLVDVGGQYDGKKKFDHHQHQPDLPQHEDGTPFSSFGMVYHHFKQTILEEYCEQLELASDRDQFFAVVDDHLIRRLVKPVDAWDNGYPGATCPNIADILSSTYNAVWWEKSVPEDTYFFSALRLAQEYLDSVFKAGIGKYLAQLMSPTIEREDGIMVLPIYFPYQDYVAPEDKFCVLPSKEGKWNLLTIPVQKKNRDLPRQEIPSAWLEHPPHGAIFVHKARFIAVFETKEQALAAAKQALAL